MLTPTQKCKLNHQLNSAGLASIENPRDLLAQLALGIRTHKQFRDLLMKVVPEERTNCYNSLKPFIHFEVKSLSDYLADARTEADADNPVTGALTAYEDYNPTRKPLERLAEEAIALREREDNAKQRLELTCKKCTFVDYFFGQDRLQPYADAKSKGWSFEKIDGKEKALCPKCTPPERLVVIQ
jgi:hypothetical protein